MRKFLILFSIILSIQTFSEGNYITIKPSKQSEEKNKVSKIDDTGNVISTLELMKYLKI